MLLHIADEALPRRFLLTVLMLGLAAQCTAQNPLVMENQFYIGKDAIASWSEAVAGARGEIFIAAYKLSSRTALEALIDAHRRGVEIKMVLDAKAARRESSLATAARQAGLDVVLWPSDQRGKLHAKLTLIDRREVILGSFNLTESAEKSNTELYFHICSEDVAREFYQQWEALYRASTSLKGTKNTD